MGDSWGHPVATTSPKPGPETLGDQIQIPPQSSDGTATGPASHQVSSLLPTQITTRLHSQLAALVQRQKSTLLDSTGGFLLRCKTNLNVAPCGRRKLLVGSTLQNEPSGKCSVLTPWKNRQGLPDKPSCGFHSQLHSLAVGYCSMVLMEAGSRAEDLLDFRFFL